MPLPNRNRRKPTDDVPVEEEPLSYLEQEAEHRMFRADMRRSWLVMAVGSIGLVLSALLTLFLLATLVVKILDSLLVLED